MAAPTKLIPMVVTDDLRAQREFYADTLGWETVFDMDAYLQVRHGADPADPELAFATDAVSTPMRVPLAAYAGSGLVVDVPVVDVDAHHRSVLDAGVKPATEPADMPWGVRAFIVTDPAGVHLEFFQGNDA